eukprot:1022674-Prymnesium_polylepis.1
MASTHARCHPCPASASRYAIDVRRCKLWPRAMWNGTHPHHPIPTIPPTHVNAQTETVSSETLVTHAKHVPRAPTSTINHPLQWLYDAAAATGTSGDRILKERRLPPFAPGGTGTMASD